MKIKQLPLSGLKLITPEVFSDKRGFFLESYRRPLYKDAGIDTTFFQDNLVFSYKNTIRGLHFQISPGQDKLVYVIHGKIIDIAVDIRPGSDTFGLYHAEILSDQNRNQFYIPHGFAHGYGVFDNAYVAYKVSNIYIPNAEMGFRYNDPNLKINWQISNPILSEKDQSAPLFNEINFNKWF
jgi:dTDP-4-dehydrorhamnose 3,5-epimerase